MKHLLQLFLYDVLLEMLKIQPILKSRQGYLVAVNDDDKLGFGILGSRYFVGADSSDDALRFRVQLFLKNGDMLNQMLDQ